MSQTNILVEPVALADQAAFFKYAFPMMLTCRTADCRLADALDWIRSEAEQLKQCASRNGAILFRDFPIRTAEDFDAFVAAFGDRNFPYDESLSNAVRVNRTERVFTANEAPADVAILLHHEMAQTPIYPSRLFFFCENPADSGGATPICRSDVLLEQLQREAPEFVRDCQQKQLKYTNVMPPQTDQQSGMGRSWQSTLSIETREQAEQRLAELGYTWEWLDDGSLSATTPELPAVRDLPSGRQSFFNQLIAAFQGWKDHRNDPSKAITHGDGTPLDKDAVMLAAELAESITVDIPWQHGDVALVDNFVTMHGRRTFEGRRSILASLIAAD